MGTYRNRRVRATVRQHLADAAIGLTIGIIGAIVLYLVTVAIVIQLGIIG